MKQVKLVFESPPLTHSGPFALFGSSYLLSPPDANHNCLPLAVGSPDPHESPDHSPCRPIRLFNILRSAHSTVAGLTLTRY